MLLSSGSNSGSKIDLVEHALKEGLDIIRKEVNDANRRADEQFPKIQEVNKCNKFGQRYSIKGSSYEKLGSDSYYANKASVDDVVKYCTDLAEKWKKEGEAIHQANLFAIESNKKLVEKIQLTMKYIGIPDSYNQEVMSSRGSRYKTERKTSGYIEDIRKFIYTSDDYEIMLSQYSAFL